MQYVYDSTGKRYLDMFGGILTTSIGHCHPKLVDAVKRQSEKLWHTSSIHLTEEVHEYASKLASKFPTGLDNLFFCNSGSEANDLAILMARLHTGVFDVVALRNAYHGASPYNMGLCGVGTWRYNFPSNLGFHHTTCPDPYRGRFGGSLCRDTIATSSRSCDCKSSEECRASKEYIEDLKSVMNTTIPAKVAGMMIESIQGVGGVVQFPKEYVKTAAEIIRSRGGLVIMDEVQTGFGRTGSNFWGFQSHKVVPDIVTMAKGIGNGFPMAAVATTKEIASCMTQALYFNTFGGNPLASIVGSTVLDVIHEEGMQDNSLELGNKLITKLCELKNKHSIIGDVRGQGFMVGVEMVKDQMSREPIPKADMDRLIEACKDHGLILGRGGPFGTVFRVTPPMCVNDSDIEFTIQVMDQVFGDFIQTHK